MRKNIVAGKPEPGEASFSVLNPFDGSLVEEVASAGADDIERALAAAEGARRRVASLTRHERAAVLTGVSERLSSRGEEVARLLAMEVGKTLREARGEVARAAGTFAFAAEEARRLAGEIIPFDAASGGTRRRGFNLRVPIGTVVAITPFNFPLNLAAHKVAPAIAAGNPVIVKPASQTPLSGLILGEIVLDAGFPPEALSVLCGPGSTVGMVLVRDARPRMVTFTGSVDVGKRIASEAGFKKIGMELGSNSGVVVTESGDLDFACKRITLGAFALAGQVCISVQRVVAARAVFDEVVTRIVEQTERLTVGNQLDEATDMGPMVSQADAERLEKWVGEAAAGGAEIRTGAKREGSVYSPTVLTGVSRDARVWREEAFGPVVCVNAYDTFEEALAVVNDSRYGLQAGVFTNSVSEAFEAIETLDVGGVIINDFPTYRVDQMPYGGMKDSGIGREGLKYAVHEMTEEKLVCFNFWKPE
jgi:acyl-CoA reductase-like NAD-dependent aldehyde dehydrogenase